MERTLIKFAEFTPIVRLIKRLDYNSGTGKATVEILLPSNLVLDTNKILQYFDDDVKVNMTRGEGSFLKGSIKDQDFAIWLVNEFRNTQW